MAVHHLGQGVDVAGLDVLEALVEGAEVVVEHALSGGGQGGDGAAVEAVHQRDDGIAALAVVVEAVLAGRLDGALVGLGAGVHQKQLIVVVARSLAQTGSQVALQLVDNGIGIKAELLELAGQHVHIMRVAVADADYGVATVKVEVFLTLVVPHAASAAAHDVDIIKRINVE